jgi:hypothetical protein
LIKIGAQQFRQVWLADFEFSAPPGDKPVPICLVAIELSSGKRMKVWSDQLNRMNKPPYEIDCNSLFVAYYASAELGCHLALGWPLPENVLDLYVEFRNLTNGRPLPSGKGLLGALVYFGLGSIAASEKDEMRDLAIRGGPYTVEERDSLLNYCESDVEALCKLFQKMIPAIDMPRALVRGRYMKSAAQIEFNGVPIDQEALEKLKASWDDIQVELINEIDSSYGVFEGRTFKASQFDDWLVKNGIPWPRLESGNLDLCDDTFKEMAQSYPQIAPLRELRLLLSQLRMSNLTVGIDGRNRCLLSAFSARTSRNQPSNSKFIFGPSVWLRGLIRPETGMGIAYIDWEQQEFGIAAALSGDRLMIEAYNSGDPYLEFAKQAGAVPKNATKESHKAERNLFKACALAVQYGMGPKSLANRIGSTVFMAKELLRLHKETYQVFWKWSDSVLDYAMLNGRLWTVFGWKIHLDGIPNPRSLRNFPMQANGAEMLRIACFFAVEEGIKVCAPVHDAILIEAPDCELKDTISRIQKLMAEASNIVLGGFELRTDYDTVYYPDRYMDERGQDMWNRIWMILERKTFSSEGA